MTRKTNANQRLRSISVRSGYKYSKASVSKSVSKSPSSPIPARQRSLSRGYSRQTDESESKRSASRSPGKNNNRIKIMPKTVVRVLAWRGRLLRLSNTNSTQTLHFVTLNMCGLKSCSNYPDFISFLTNMTFSALSNPIEITQIFRYKRKNGYA